MPVQFESIGAALSMNGHGAYVWSVYLIAVLVIVFLLLGPVVRARRISLERRGQIRREQVRKDKEITDAPGT